MVAQARLGEAAGAESFDLKAWRFAAGDDGADQPRMFALLLGEAWFGAAEDQRRCAAAGGWDRHAQLVANSCSRVAVDVELRGDKVVGLHQIGDRDHVLRVAVAGQRVVDQRMVLGARGQMDRKLSRNHLRRIGNKADDAAPELDGAVDDREAGDHAVGRERSAVDAIDRTDGGNDSTYNLNQIFVHGYPPPGVIGSGLSGRHLEQAPLFVIVSMP